MLMDVERQADFESVYSNSANNGYERTRNLNSNKSKWIQQNLKWAKKNSEHEDKH